MKKYNIVAARALFITTLTFVISTSGETTMTMGDIAALANSGSWDELLVNAQRVKPSSRTEAWKNHVTRAATEIINDKRMEPLETLSLSEKAIRAYPHLQMDSAFMKARGESGLLAFERCFELPRIASDCKNSLKAFIAGDPKNSDLAFGAGRLAVRAFSTKYVAIPFFHSALKGQTNDSRCRDGELKTAIKSAAEMEASEESKLALDIMVTSCAKADPAFAKELAVNEQTRKTMCPGIAKTGAFEGIAQKKCLEVKK
jgi:hypothetical protein